MYGGVTAAPGPRVALGSALLQCWLLQFEPPASGFQGGMAVKAQGCWEPQNSQIRPVRANKTVPCPSDSQARSRQGREDAPQPMPKAHTPPSLTPPTLDSRRMPLVPAETSTLVCWAVNCTYRLQADSPLAAVSPISTEQEGGSSPTPRQVMPPRSVDKMREGA